MADKVINVKHQLRHDTETNWNSKNPVLLSGEIGFVTGTLKYKIGDGTKKWSELTYHNALTDAEKTKLSGIADGANKTTVDSALSSTSTNPVQNKVINSALAGKSNTNHSHDLSTMINTLTEGASTPTDNDYYVSQYAGGGTTTTTYHRRPLKALFEYIKGKLSAVAISGSYNDLSNKPTIPSVGNGTVTIKQGGTSKGIFTMNQSGNTTIELTDNNTWRGIQDNLTSTATDQSLSAAKGKWLNENKACITTLSSENLNNVITPGFYNADGSNTVTNKPSGVDYFGLIIIHRANGSYYTQILFTDNSSYRRYCVNGTWGGWTQEILTDTKYTHPSYTAKSNGLYKVTVDATGHVSGTTAVSKADITALGIPSTNTTYSTGTASALGLTKLYTGTGTATDGTMTQAAIKSALDGKASINHKQAYTSTDCTTYTADDNTMGVTPAAVKKAIGLFDPKAHTHNYAGSSSAGGSANSAVKLATARKIELSDGASGSANFDGSANTNISVTKLKESYLSWGGKNFSGDYGCIDAAMIPDLGANRMAFGKANGITIEYSRDNGSTWIDYGASDISKTGLFSSGSGFVIGKADSSNKATETYMLRVIVDTDKFGIYTKLNKFAFNISTNGSNGCYCSIDASLESTPTTWNNFANKVPISGWSGWNIINISDLTTYGNASSWQYGLIRFTFGCASNGTTYNGLQINRIMGFGGVGWIVPSNMAKYGAIYSYDISQNVTFPASVTAPTFIGKLQGNADTATKATQDSGGQQINTTYIKGLSVSGKTITYTKGNGSTGTITTQDTNTTYGVATTSANGLMSSSDKSKLDGIASGANKYTHPGYTAKSSGFYKVTVDSTGHVSATTAVTKADITGLGIPASDTNTWRGIQNNLTSTSTSDSLSAAQGKALNDKFGSYLPLSGGNLTGRVTRSGSGSWISDRDKVAVFGTSTSSGSYCPVVGQKTSKGAWTIGNLAGNENLVFNYTTDTNYNAGNNSNTPVYLPASGGTIALTSNIGNGTITITQNGTSKGTFTMNQSGNTTIALTDTNTNTWRGVQNNLTSTATDQSLSAYQGKLLNDKISNKVLAQSSEPSSQATGDIWLKTTDL